MVLRGTRGTVARSSAAWQHSRTGRAPITFPRGLGGALTRSRPDCVVSWEYGPATLRALAWARRRRVPLLVFSELTPWSDAALSPLQRRVHRLLAPRAAGFIVASLAGSGAAARPGRGPGAGRGGASERGPRRASGRARAERRQERAGGPVADPGGRAAGAGQEPRRADRRRSREAGFAEGEAELEIRGRGPLEAELRALASGSGVPVRFPGPAPPGELGAVYAAADVLALVSTYEPFGVDAARGRRRGLPLIASRRAGAVGDVAVDGENAIVIEPDDRGQIAAALRRLVREPELRERLAAAAARSPSAIRRRRTSRRGSGRCCGERRGDGP